MKQRIAALLTAVLLSFSLTACADSGDAPPEVKPTDDEVVSMEPTALPDASPETSEPEPTPEPSETVPAYDGPINPLTGEPAEDELAQNRPVAVMLNNLKQAMPQLGNSQADIIYEVLAEGGITRMLAVYQSVDGVGLIGSVRSARTYYLELALGHDAVYLHAGGSPDAYDKIKAWQVTAFDCVRGPYEGTLFWRDQNRIRNNGRVHSVVTSGETIQKLLPTYGVRLEHEEGYAYEMQFAQSGAPAEGTAAEKLTVPYSSYKTGVFEYDAETGKYLVSEYGSAYVDGNSGAQVAVTNVLVLKAKCSVIPGDDAGRITVDLTQGDGWFACGGKILPIQWSKDGVNAQLTYRTQAGEPLTLGTGNSYVNIIPLDNEITVE